jgi:predicted Zn finger-like uncharacterized protein
MNDQPIGVTCDQCGQRFRVKAAGLGRRVKCPNCSNPVLVTRRLPDPLPPPITPAPQPPHQAAFIPEQQPAPASIQDAMPVLKGSNRRSSPRLKTNPWVVIAIAAAAVFIGLPILACGGCAMFFGSAIEQARVTRDAKMATPEGRREIRFSEIALYAPGAAERAVKSVLKSPSSAVFASSPTVRTVGDRAVMVSGTVDAANSFNAQLRQQYSVFLITPDDVSTTFLSAAVLLDGSERVIDPGAWAEWQRLAKIEEEARKPK